MQIAAMTRRFLTGCSSKVGLAEPEIVASRDGLLRHIVASQWAQTVHSQELFVKLANELIQFAEQAYLMRDLNTLDEVSRILMNLPVDVARHIGLYYHALAINRKGQRDEAENLLQTVVDNAPITYRARALQTLGANYLDKGQSDETLRFQLEALRAASDKNAHGLQTTVNAHFEIAIVRSLAGDHQGSLSSFEKLWPLVCQVAKQHPFYFYVFHNELAVELGEIGRIEEAEAACKIALASPFAPAYPEWSETRDEIAAKRASATPSIVAINRPPEADPSPQGQPKPSRALVFSWPATNKNSFQRAIVALNLGGITLLILYCLRKCVRTRGPPALSRATFRPLSRNIVESAEGKASTEQNQFTLQLLCAQYYRFLAVIGVCVSLRFHNCSSRAPPLRRDGVSDSGSVDRLITTSSVHCFKADYRHDSHLRLIPRREVTPRSQFASFQKIWASCHVGDSLPTLAERVRVEGTSVEPTHVRVQEDTYDYSNQGSRSRK